MTTSPLQFARDWEQLQSRLREQPHADLRLLSLAEFWPQLEPRVDDPAFQTYQREYLSLLDDALKAAKAHDLSASEWAAILAALDEIAAQFPQPEFATGIQLALKELARLHFYVGNIESGLLYAQRLAGVVAVPKIDLNCLENVYEIDALRRLIEMLGESDSAVKAQLEAILAEWTLERESVRHDAIHCLFVERESSTGAARGRLRTLEGEIELGRGNDAPDELTCHNQVIAPDDPFIGVGYASLAAVRDALKRQSITIADGRRIHARYKINSSNSVFTGDSIGLAMALVAYTQALRPLVRWHERYLSGEVAVTAAIDDSGRLLPINTQTLAAKIDRAFFSHVRYLVVPEPNAEAARAHLELLRQEHPRRQLLLITAATLTDVISDHNVVRAERICLGQFVARKAYRYSRMTKVQIPLLLLLGYLLLSSIDPRTFWLFFDRNPAFVLPIVDTGTIEVFNADSSRLWTHKFPHPFSAFESAVPGIPYHMRTFDLNSDGKNEVIVIPPTIDDVDENSWMYCFDHTGNLKYRRYLAIPNQYPGDTPSSVYSNLQVYPITAGGMPYLLTIVTQIGPARSHVVLWNADGDSLWWYIHSGAAGLLLVRDLDGDLVEELIFSAFNNRLGCAAYFALRRSNESGCSPPYDDESYDLTWIERANHYAYIAFPPTDLCEQECGSQYNQPGIVKLRDRVGGMLDVYTGESVISNNDIIYTLDSSFRVRFVLLSDTFLRSRQRLVDTGRLPAIDDSIYRDNTLRAVRYWFTDHWVTEAQLQDNQSSRQ